LLKKKSPYRVGKGLTSRKGGREGSGKSKTEYFNRRIQSFDMIVHKERKRIR